MLPTITQSYPPLPLDDLVDLLRSFPMLALGDKQALIRRLVDVHPVLSLHWGPGSRYRRARVLRPGEVPATVDELIWRRGAPARLGRANPAGFDVLYLADRAETALREVRAEDDEVVMADFTILDGHAIHVAPIGELTQVQRTGRGFLSGDASGAISDLINAADPDEIRSLLITESFLLECLTNRDDDYEVSSTVSKAVFDKLPAVTAVAYPSRRQFGGLNFAVRVETFWEDWGLVAVRRGRAQHLAQGYYRFRPLRHVEGVTNDGHLVWEADEDDREGAVAPLSPPWRPAP